MPLLVIQELRGGGGDCVSARRYLAIEYLHCSEDAVMTLQKRQRERETRGPHAERVRARF